MALDRRLIVVLLAAGCAARGAVPVADPPPPPAAPPPAPPAPRAPDALFGAAFDEALAAVGLGRADARCRPGELALFGHGRFPLRLYEVLQDDPLALDAMTSTLRRAALAAAPRIGDALAFAAARADAGVRYGLLGDPVRAEAETAAAPAALHDALAGLDPGVRPPSTEDVPPAVRAAAAVVLRAAARARPWIDRAYADLPPGRRAAPPAAAAATLLLGHDDEDAAARAAFERAAAGIDLPYLARAAAEVAAAVDLARDLLAAAPPAPAFEWRHATSMGLVLLRGGGDDVDGPADGGPFLLRVDTGGNDRYGAGAATGPGTPVSVLLDAGGDDHYEGPVDGAAFGAGYLGVAVLADLRGNDRYVLRGGRSLGLGAGVFGAGALFDGEGDDAYEGDAFCMGAATAGFGVLADLAGADGYRAFAYAQGFGFVRGAGLLVDVAGDDSYVADDTEIRRPSPQTKDHNVSLCQGFGYGVRADYLDGHSLAGGAGLLVDGAGDDTYACGVFGQGGGYWMGVGMLLDGGGDDRYAGVWYVQGASAHFAVGVLEDAAGNDTYAATHNMAQGAGHDFSVGMLLDRAGDDAYVAPNLSLGGGNANGVGFFVDAAGSDRYETRGTTLGLASVEHGPDVPTLRHRALTLGVFLDLGGGRDAYAVHGGSVPGDGGLWTQAMRRPGGAPRAVGVGADR